MSYGLIGPDRTGPGVFAGNLSDFSWQVTGTSCKLILSAVYSKCLLWTENVTLLEYLRCALRICLFDCHNKQY